MKETLGALVIYNSILKYKTVKLDLARHSLVLHRQQAEQCLGVDLGIKSSQKQNRKETYLKFISTKLITQTVLTIYRNPKLSQMIN